MLCESGEGREDGGCGGGTYGLHSWSIHIKRRGNEGDGTGGRGHRVCVCVKGELGVVEGLVRRIC